MCARVDQRPFVVPGAWRKAFGVNAPEGFQPARSVFPLEAIAAVRVNPDTAARESQIFSWGLNPVWSKDVKFGRRTYNARGETVESLASFKHAFKRRRCIVPAEAFYEWNAKKELYRITRKAGMFAFAGLWEMNKNLNILSCTVITSPPNKLIEQIGHDRSPVILGEEQFEAWLDPALQEVDLLKSFLDPYPGKDLVIEMVQATQKAV